jgi:hypothetical protein
VLVDDTYLSHSGKSLADVFCKANYYMQLFSGISRFLVRRDDYVIFITGIAEQHTSSYYKFNKRRELIYVAH